MSDGWLSRVVDEAFDVGKSIDLKECVYGKNKLTPSYYYFLAGMCRTQNLKRILEVGTFRGGSVCSMWHGIPDDQQKEARLVTVDVEERDTRQIDAIHQIEKVTGDPLDAQLLNDIAGKFGWRDIDLLFLDSTKKGRIVMSQLATFCLFLRPKFIILDDITLNPTMEKMWTNATELFGEYALNLAHSHPQIRKMGEINKEVVKHPGFGIIAFRPFHERLRG